MIRYPSTGRCQCKHCHILDNAHILFNSSSVPVSFWGESVLTAIYLINSTPHPSSLGSLLLNTSPYGTQLCRPLHLWVHLLCSTTTSWTNQIVTPLSHLCLSRIWHWTQRLYMLWPKGKLAPHIKARFTFHISPYLLPLALLINPLLSPLIHSLIYFPTQTPHHQILLNPRPNSSRSKINDLRHYFRSYSRLVHLTHLLRPTPVEAHFVSKNLMKDMDLHLTFFPQLI